MARQAAFDVLVTRIPEEGEGWLIARLDHGDQAADSAPDCLIVSCRQQLAPEASAPLPRRYQNRNFGALVRAEIEAIEPHEAPSGGSYLTDNPRIAGKATPPQLVGDSLRDSKTLGFEPWREDLQVPWREWS